MMKWLMTSTIGKIAALVLVCVVAGGVVYEQCAPPTQTVRTIDNTKIVTVDRPVLTEKIVTKVITDPKDKLLVRSLLSENERLKLDVTGLTQTLAQLHSTGGVKESGGVITIIPNTTQVGDPVYEFKDFQLDAKYASSGKIFDYTLDQQFEVLSTTGRGKDGGKVGIANVFQVKPDGTRIPVPSKTVDVYADEATSRWLVSGRIQAGLGVTTARETGGVVAFQWLKHGKSPAAEDVKLSVASPALFLTKTTHDVGVLPLSINLGSLPHQPFSNLWVSPFVSRTRIAGVITATF
jgi:hypothetical protein